MKFRPYDVNQTKLVNLDYRKLLGEDSEAVINNIDVIATWNCKHMANVENKRIINAVNMMLGYKQIDIVTPLEVVGYG